MKTATGAKQRKIRSDSQWPADRVATLNDLRRAGVRDVKLARLLNVTRQRINHIGGPLSDIDC